MEKNEKNIVEKLLSYFLNNESHRVSVKSLFGGSGIFYSDIMFAWIYEGELYLKAYHHYLSAFIELNMSPLTFDIGVTTKLLQYYQVTDELWDDENKLGKIVQMVISSSLFEQNTRQQMKEERIKDLPNITASLERSLFRSGIVNVNTFRELGLFKSYYQLTQHNRRISNKMLLILHSALQGVHVATLTENEKHQLEEEYHQFLASQHLSA